MRLLKFTLTAVVQCWAFTKASQLTDAGSTQSKLDNDLFWGTYRPNLYFGTRPRQPNSLLSGLMWFGLDNQRNWESIRHSCELGDNLSEYGYSRHNGLDFGEQAMVDTDQGVEINSEFIKVPGENGGSWAVRFSGRTLNEDTQGVSLMYYFGLEGNGTMAMSVKDDKVAIKGKTPELGRFDIRIVPAESNEAPQLPSPLTKIKGMKPAKKISGIAMKIPKGDIWHAKDIFQKKLIMTAQTRARNIMEHTDGKGPLSGYALFGLDTEVPKQRGKNLFFAQMVVQGEFSFDVIYECADENAKIDNQTIKAIVSSRRKEFDYRFESTFGLREKGFRDAEVEMARNALSSLIGGIGYFYGSGLVSKDPKPEYGQESDEIAKPNLSEPYSLFATTPSRPFFPRGFLWDEGFHQLVLGQWDAELSMDILHSWFRIMDSSGWIAREQILGDEARSKVPEEFQVQYPNFANPPTLLFALEMYTSWLKSDEISQKLVENNVRIDDLVQEHKPKYNKALMRENIGKLAQYVSKLLEFFHRTQAGEMGAPDSNGEQSMTTAHGFRWRGRTTDHTLTSGIDDYPRARPPSKGELHVDLFSWVTYMELVNSDMAAFAGGRSADINQTLSKQDQLDMHLKWLDELHWNEDENMYCDVTVRVRDAYDELEDDESNATERSFVCHKGYVTLFPMILGLLPVNSPKLGHLLDIIENPEELWTDYGIRSLSKNDVFYGKGENYWRGPVWLNINYLVLSSLYRNYNAVKGPYQEQAQRIYTNLRQNLIRNVFEQYQETRFFWEQYNPEDGSGQRTHPFTGWTTLIVPIMAEKY
ncbi:glycoside hydrolase [Coemansia spiralis]|nr:glycoside hydrolase [Coemansia spiralis]